MLHKDALKLLFPLELGGDFATDIELEGQHLDSAQARAEVLLKEMFPDQAYELLTSWERVCGLVPGAEDTLQKRRERILQKLREIGGLSRAFFIAYAATLGYTITIDELWPFMTGIGRCGDPLYIREVIWIWRVNVADVPLYYFRTGQSATGERLLWWPAQDVLESVFRDIKPAHTFVIFNYS